MKKLRPFRLISKILLGFYITFSVYTQSWALHIIDIDETNFAKGVAHVNDSKKTEKKSSQYLSVRLVDFDVDQQKFERISYYLTPDKKEYKFEHKGLKVTYGYSSDKKGKFSVEIDATGISEDIWCFSHVKPTGANVRDFEWIDRETPACFISCKGELKYLNISNLKPLLEKLTERRNTTPLFQIQFLIGGSDFKSSYNLTGEAAGSIYAAGVNHKDEVGLLGELAADITFTAHGFKKYHSKIKGKKGEGEGNKGFDGIYINSEEKDISKQQLWIVESKFTQTPLTPGKMEGHLSPKVSKGANITTYNSSNDKNLLTTAATIVTVAKNHPENVFFLGYNVMSNGTVRTHFFKFIDIFLPEEPKTPANTNQVLSLDMLTPQTPPQIQEKILHTFLSEFAQKTGKSMDEIIKMTSRLKIDDSSKEESSKPGHITLKTRLERRF